MDRRTRSGRTLLAALALVAAGCVSNSGGGCPRPGLDLARRCKRLCVLGPGTTTPLPCACVADCLCWQMGGHPRRAGAEPEEPPSFLEPPEE